jgi:hypothetical protein
MSFFLADKIAPDSILLCGIDVVSAGREHSDPLFCSEIEEVMTDILTQLGMPVNPNPRWYLSQPEAQSDLPSRMLDLQVVDRKTEKIGVMEIDGASYHADRKAEDARRDQVLKQMGIGFIKRYSASACYHNPFGTATHFINSFREHCDNHESQLRSA